jgi:hypothetical protein
LTYLLVSLDKEHTERSSDQRQEEVPRVPLDYFAGG